MSEKIIIEAEGKKLEADDNRENTIRVLRFSLERQWYCLELSDLRGVERIPPITRVPNMPGSIIGVINIRGEIISLIDIRGFLGQRDRIEITDRSMAILTDITGGLMAILADEVKAATDIESSSLLPPVSTIVGAETEYSRGEIRFGEDLALLLNLKKIRYSGYRGGNDLDRGAALLSRIVEKRDESDQR